MNADLETSAPGSGLSEDFRPRFRRDALFAESDDGAYLQRPGDEFRLRGPSVYRWLSTLVPHLTGEHTVARLTDGLSESHRTALTRLIATLAERGYVHADRAGIADRSSPAVRERFGRQIEYVAHLAPDGGASFDAFRETRLLLLGSDALVTAVGTGLLQNGSAAVDLGEHTPAAAQRLRAEAERLRASGCACTVRELASQDLDTADFATEYDLVVAAGTDVRRLLALNERVREAGPPLLPLLVLDDRAVAGPLSGPDHGPCVRCMLLRQSSARSGSYAARLWRDAALGGDAAAQCPPELAGMLGTLLAFEVFRRRTGVLDAETERGLVVQDLDTAESYRTELLPHPLCESCGRRAQTPSTSRDRRTTSYDTLFGVDGAPLSGYLDAELSQSPLRVGRVGLTSMDGPLEEQRCITAFDQQTVDAARQRAVRAAMSCYAEQAAGRGSPIEAAYDGADDVVPGDRLSLRSGMGRMDESLMPAVSMVDGRACVLPVAAAFPQSFRNQTRAFEPTSAGAACAESLEAAQRDGLLSALGYAGLSSALQGHSPAAGVRLDDEDEAELAFLRRVTDVLEQPVRLLELPGCAPGFGCLALVGDDPVWALGTGHRRADAATAALRDAVGIHGLRAAGEDVDLGNPLLPGFDPRALPVTEPGPKRPSVTHDSILEELRVRGTDVLVVDTTPRDVRQAGLVTVRVLLREGPC